MTAEEIKHYREFAQMPLDHHFQPTTKLLDEIERLQKLQQTARKILMGCEGHGLGDAQGIHKAIELLSPSNEEGSMKSASEWRNEIGVFKTAKWTPTTIENEIRRIQADTIAWVLLDQMNDFQALRRKLELKLKELDLPAT